MKIKKKINASDVIGLEEINNMQLAQQTEEQLEISQENCPYANAVDLIKAAIEALAEVASTDEVAKDSIANLSVVLLDLKGNC